MTWVTPRSTFFLKPTMPLVPSVMPGSMGNWLPDHDMLAGGFASVVRVFLVGYVCTVSQRDWEDLDGWIGG